MLKAVIEFTRPRGPYAVGDIAGFEDVQLAQRYIDSGAARPYAADQDQTSSHSGAPAPAAGRGRAARNAKPEAV